MGKYINADSKGKSLGSYYKADALCADGAKRIEEPESFIPNLVCVVDNGPFEAAAYCYDKREFEEFKQSDSRPKQWLIYEHANITAK